MRQQVLESQIVALMQMLQRPSVNERLSLEEVTTLEAIRKYHLSRNEKD